MAAQLSQCLSVYREMLLNEPQLQTHLTLRECTQNSSDAFIKGILEPLSLLKAQGKIPMDNCLILVDGLSDAEFHKSDYGDTIASFLARHMTRFPQWLKLVISVRSSFAELTKMMPIQRISLDKVSNSEFIQKDAELYISHRLQLSNTLRTNVSLNGKVEQSMISKFRSHLQSLSRGCFLYLKLTLDLIEQGYLVMKSPSYKVLPINLSEIFLLQCNLKFPTIRAFERVTPILNVALASLYPLSDELLFQVRTLKKIHF